MDPAERQDARILGAFIGVAVATGLFLVVAAAYDIYPGVPPPDGMLVVQGGVVFDGTGATPRPARIVISGERIACVGSDCPAPAEARVIDAAGLAVLPGLIDLKVHLASPDRADAGRAFPLRMWDHARQRPHVRRSLHRAGVTTVRELGNVKDTTLRLKRQLASGRLAGPRLFTAGPVFTAPFGIPTVTDFGGNLYLIENATRQVSDAGSARAEVGRLANEGVDGIAAVLDAGVVDRLPRLAPDVLGAIAEAAHERGLWVAVSTGRAGDVRDAVEAGVDTIQYGALYGGTLDEATMTRLRARGVTYIPVLAGIESFLRWVKSSECPEGFPPEAWQSLQALLNARGVRAGLEPAFDSVARAAAAGVRIGTGTSADLFGPSLRRELELLVEAGLSPPAALLAATRDGARALHAERDLGTIEPGKLADLVLVAGRPWERIADVSAVRLVIQGGRVVADTAAPRDRAALRDG